jgi:hypothetical protein
MALEMVPALQGKHSLRKWSAKYPAGQIVQAVARALETFPTPHFRQLSDIRLEYSPAGQSEQVT